MFWIEKMSSTDFDSIENKSYGINYNSNRNNDRVGGKK